MFVFSKTTPLLKNQKSFFKTFSNRKRKRPRFKLQIGDVIIQQVKKVKYLASLMKEVRQGNLNTHCAKERGNSNAKQSAEKNRKITLETKKRVVD